MNGLVVRLMRPELHRNQRQHLNRPWMQVQLIQHSQLIQVDSNQAHQVSQLIQRSQLIQVDSNQEHQASLSIRPSQVDQVGSNQHQRQNQSLLLLELMQF